MSSEKTQMKLGVIIPNYSKSPKDLDMLKRAISSVRLHEPRMPILIVDDASPWPPRHVTFSEMLIPVWHRKVNGGYSAAINSGLSILRSAGFTHVLTMNSDVEVTTPFRLTLEDAFKQADIIGGRLLYPTGRIQAAGFEIDDEGRPLEIAKGKIFHDAAETHMPRYCFGVTGALQAFSLAIGNYSEAYGLGFEDVEFCARAWSTGRKVAYIPTIQGVHGESETRGKEPSAREMASMRQWMEVDSRLHDLPRIRQRIAALNRV